MFPFHLAWNNTRSDVYSAAYPAFDVGGGAKSKVLVSHSQRPPLSLHGVSTAYRLSFSVTDILTHCTVFFGGGGPWFSIFCCSFRDLSIPFIKIVTYKKNSAPTLAGYSTDIQRKRLKLSFPE